MVEGPAVRFAYFEFHFHHGIRQLVECGKNSCKPPIWIISSRFCYLSVIDLQHEQQAQVEEIEKVETVVFLLQYSNVGPAPNFFDLSMRSGRLKKERNVRVKISQLINYFARNFLKDICCPGFLSRGLFQDLI